VEVEVKVLALVALVALEVEVLEVLLVQESLHRELQILVEEGVQVKLLLAWEEKELLY
jgi:hypothetical protein